MEQQQSGKAELNFEINKAVLAQERRNITGARPNFNVNAHSLENSNIIICEVVDPAKYGVHLTATNSALVRVLSGPNFDPIDEFTFTALNTSGTQFSFTTKVFVLYSELYTPVIVLGFGGSDGVIDGGPHSHNGLWDYGWAGFFSGSTN